jgi:putative serine/threonine protein kinase
LSEFIQLSEVLEHKVGRFLCWPEHDKETSIDRVKQLESLGVQSLAIGGPHNIQGTLVLGKGHAGIVIRAIWCGEEVALKARRTDADRESMEREAGFIVHVNKWGLGPELYGFSRDFIVMEKLVGKYLGDWVKENLEDKRAVRRNLKVILDIAWELDQSGIDHGELTRIKRHFIVTTNGPRVIDFESASFDRTPSNVTSTVQSIFMNYRFKKVIEGTLQLPEREYLINALKKYKQKSTPDNYQNILNVCNL